MDILKLQKKIETEIHDKQISKNLTRVLCNSPEDFLNVVENWVSGEENDYTFSGISLTFIREKEKCSYLNALLRMHVLISNPSLIPGYPQWKPRYKDGGR
ncbi:MAG: hypothetical protein J6B37_06470 [Clostridia bacterium]|nr:hypothetical protein [Clostridia bacterium]